MIRILVPRPTLLTCFVIALSALILPLAYGATAPQAGAQHAGRTLTGTVTDSSHEPLRGVVVEIENEKVRTVQSYITDETGQYRFLRLDRDCDYKAWATYRGVRSKTKEISLFDDHPVKVIDFVINLH